MPRLVSVPGRTVRHWETNRVIDDAGMLYDPNSPVAAFYLAAGDLALVEDAAPAAAAPQTKE